MFSTSIILFALAALGGLTMAGMFFAKKRWPGILTAGHGVLAVVGLIVLIVAVMGIVDRNKELATALVLFIVTALGGITLVSFDLRKKSLPPALIVIHGVLAIVSFIVLIVGVSKMV